MGLFDDVRIWSVNFQPLKVLENFAVPYEAVLEKQTSPRYCIHGKNRPKDHTQIVCTVSGEGSFKYKNKVYRLTPGKAFMSTLGDPDATYCYPPHAAEPWVFIWISFAGNAAVNAVQELADTYGHVVDLPLDRGFVKHIESLKTPQTHGVRFVTPTEGAKVVFDVLATLGETLEEQLLISKQSKIVRSAKLLIMRNLDRSLDLQSIARELNVSREHLSRVFVSQTGTTPGAFASVERMRLAARLLREGNLSCQEIAERTGFSSACSFARAFKSQYNVSPANYSSKKS